MGLAGGVADVNSALNNVVIAISFIVFKCIFVVVLSTLISGS